MVAILQATLVYLHGRKCDTLIQISLKCVPKGTINSASLNSGFLSGNGFGRNKWTTLIQNNSDPPAYIYIYIHH